ncbi:receptor-type tyrosine-protein phosphatase-like N isoform X1 [Pelobates fuscus]|uniref:receptor-type tyrosine-protein phosphatase-like N isoform X1 n=1 Tax=Pelobates fuscus TaxID=191477 RepID=UPI002FE432B9
MKLCAGLLLCLMLLSCGPLDSLGARTHGCLFDLRLCSKSETCLQDGLFGQCRERSERDVGQFQVTPGTLQQLQGVLRQLTAKGLSWRDDMTQRVMAHEIGRIPQHRTLEPLDVLDEERTSLSHTPGRTVQRLTGAGQPSTQRWGDSVDKLQYFRPRLPSQPLESTLQKQQRLPLNMKQNISPLVERYLTYFMLNSQTPKSQFGYQDTSRLRSPSRAFSATYTRPEGSRRLVYGRYQGGQEGPLTVHLSSERHHSWPELRRKLPRKSVGSEIPEDVLDSSEGMDGIPQITDFDKELQGDGRAEALRALRGSLGMPSIADAQTDIQGPGDVGSLEKNGFDVRQLSETQLEQLSTLLQLIQLDSQQNQGGRNPERIPLKRVAEGDMQHMAESESQFPVPELAPRSPDAANDTIALGTEQQNLDTRNVVSTTVPIVSLHPEIDVQKKAEQYKNLLEAINETREQKTMEKKNYHAYEESSDVPGQSSSQVQEEVGYIATDHKPLSPNNGFRLLKTLAHRVHLSTTNFINISVVGPALTFQIKQNHQNLSLSDVTNRAEALQSDLESETGMKIVQTGVGKVGNGTVFPHTSHFGDNLRFVLLIFIALACIAGIVIASAVIFCIRQHAKQREKERLAGLGPEGSGDSTFEYQDLCRQHMAGKTLFSRTETTGAAENSRVSSVSSQFSDVPQPSPSSHSSTPSWCEEPVQSNMDISTGHMILAYMEDHMRNRDRLAKEWQALCAYQAEPNSCSIAKTEANLKKNRNPDFVPYDHARIKLKSENNTSHSDYINASPIIEHDPRMPAYIATQGPLSHTIADFWQMVWENGCTVIVMLSPLVEDGVKQCDRYWPDEGSSLYHIYEVNLVSEHIWCEDFLVRSFYLKNVQSQETRTLTQFHFLSWPAEGIPSSTRPLLDFRRKVNKSFRGRSCPIIAHCSDGAGRTGTYILIDMVLNRMAKGVKEIDIAASLEHVRDQRPGMVRTKDQFEFALTAVAEEVNAILKALPQ